MTEIVYEVQGWFGDHEWSEGLYSSKEKADAVCEELWKTREGPNGPEYAKKFHKFSVEKREVQ